jgi:hypothetical protein
MIQEIPVIISPASAAISFSSIFHPLLPVCFGLAAFTVQGQGGGIQ